MAVGPLDAPNERGIEMLKRLKPTPSMIVASVALIAAIGGSAPAAGLIAGSQIKNGTITKAKLTPSLAPAGSRAKSTAPLTSSRARPVHPKPRAIG